MKATINDVAKLAGVSIKTVSRVINNEAGVRDNTREKVMAAVTELNYQPNLAARNLAGSKAFSIAYIYDNPNAYYVIDMQNGMLNACRKNGFELLIHPCNAKQEDIAESIYTMLKHSRVAGAILTPPFSEMPEFVAKIAELDIAIIRIISGNQVPDNITPCIMIDDYQAACAITEHLIDQGHSNIAFIAGDKQHNSTLERLKGYQDTLTKHKISSSPEYIFQGQYSFESGIKGAQQLLALANKPTAIFACNDEIAAGALFAARLQHIEIPRQLAIAGFENSPFSRQTWPPLTTANQPTSSIAEQATEQLIKLIRKHETKASPCFVPELIERESTLG